MFLREYHRTKDGKRHTYFALVESVRTERGPRQRIVAHLGELSEDFKRDSYYLLTLPTALLC